MFIMVDPLEGPFHGKFKASDTTMSCSQGKQMRWPKCDQGLWFLASLAEMCVAENIEVMECLQTLLSWQIVGRY